MAKEKSQVDKNELRKREKAPPSGKEDVVSLRKEKSTSEKSKTKKETKEEKELKSAGFIHRVCNYLFEEEDSSYIALFRILWGLTMCYEMYLFMMMDFGKLLHHYYLNPYDFNFKYFLFDWVQVMPYEYMRIYVVTVFIAAVFITIGLQYRFSSVYFFIGITYIFLGEAINYLNHIYLVCVISFVMIFLPCNCCYSIDSWKHPSRYRSTLPKIILLFLKLFLVIVYAYAGVVKINEDWLRGEPLRHWVGKKNMFGNLLQMESTIYFLSYGGIIYDLFVGPLLLWAPTFWIGILATLFFHCSNKILFNIGIFPYLMIASTSLFFSPWTFRRILFKLRHPFSKFEIPPSISFSQIRIRKITPKEKLIIFVVVLFLAYWVLFPIRHYTYPGDVVWNEQGHTFSWRMKLRDKNCHGAVYGYQPLIKQAFYVPVEKTLSRTQNNKVMTRPWLFAQYAHFLGDLYAINDTRAEIYTYWYCSVNYRPRQLYADPSIDFASVPKWDFCPWITELEPLPEEFNSQYPWNWEWNFNWLKGNITNIGDLVTDDRNDEREFHRNIVKNTLPQYVQFIADKHFNGNMSAVEIQPLLVRGTNPIAKAYWEAVTQHSKLEYQV